jgi:alkanesulfonate monooxygenase SsuD/methylene tetrahydromethanopterin reductase-like flavin-dependent oxidoreductase (luciferase family)
MVKSWLFDIFNYPYVPTAEGFDPQKCQELYDWHLESWELAEKVGFEGIMFSEHHYTAYNLSPSPHLLIAAIAQRTKRIRLGVMINILPMHNPRRLAEECAMLDYLTHGRLEIGVGRGVDQKEYLREGIPMEEVRPRFEDGLDFMMKALNQKVFVKNGYETSLWPQPLKRPVDRPWISALSPETMPWCGKHGYRLATAFQPTPNVKQAFANYRAAARAAGHPAGPENTMVLRPVFVAETDEQARAIAEPALNHLFGLFREAVIFEDLDHVPETFEFYSTFFRPFAGGGPVSWDILSDLGIFVIGSPSTVRDRLLAQAKELQTGNILMWGCFGTLTKEQTMRSYELLGREVVPALAAFSPASELAA